MKTYIFNIFALFLALFAVSCDRSGVYEEYDKHIPWGFCAVVVEDDNNVQFVSGATVEIYLTKEDRDNGVTPYLSKVTNDKGEALFSYEEFDKNKKGPEALKGNYYLKVTKGGAVAEATTRYLLMNSGVTTQWIKLEP